MNNSFESFFLFLSIDCDGLIVPQELPSVLSLVYSNIPPIKKGTDSRFGFGFRLGEHADFQVLLELGPQKFTRPIGMDTIKHTFTCYGCYCHSSTQFIVFLLFYIGKGADDDSDTSKRMVDQTDYNTDIKVKRNL